MSKKKQFNKKNNNRKLQGKQNAKIEQKIVLNKPDTTVQEKSIKERKGKKKNNITKYIIFTLFFFIGLLFCFWFINEQQKEIPTTNINLDIKENINIDKINLYFDFVAHENYSSQNLKRYLDYYEKYDISIKNTIIIVNNNLDSLKYTDIMETFINNKDFIEKNFERYITYYNTYNLSIDKTILAVNNNIDSHNLKLNKIIESLLKQEYYIDSNLERYINYYNKNNKLSYKEIVTRVNSNIDKKFYHNVNKTDISKGHLMLVNKFYYLDSNYVPNNLVSVNSKHGRGKLQKETYEAFKLMYNAASKEGLYLYISSPYRSYNTQKFLYNTYSKNDGKNKADTYSARAGYSEHQTGLAFDLGTASNHSINSFAESKEFKWVQKNAHKYGFILRYPYGKKYLTGYIYEPWHYRYVGVDAATYIFEHDITFEEYYAYFIK